MASSPSYSSLILADSPLAYWPLNETSGWAAHDLSGNGSDGDYQGTPTLGVDGIAGDKAMLIPDYASSGGISILSLISGRTLGIASIATRSGTRYTVNPFTLELWLKGDLDTLGYVVSDNGMPWLRLSRAATLAGDVSHPEFWWTNNQTFDTVGQDPWDPEQWHYAALTFGASSFDGWVLSDPVVQFVLDDVIYDWSASSTGFYPTPWQGALVLAPNADDDPQGLQDVVAFVGSLSQVAIHGRVFTETDFAARVSAGLGRAVTMQTVAMSQGG